jgi:hypothetical protein
VIGSRTAHDAATDNNNVDMGWEKCSHDQEKSFL